MKEIKLNKLSNEELISIYEKWIEELKNRKITRTNNIVGEIGEYLAIDYYNKTVGLPKLVSAPISTKSIDAISNRGERYTIKTVTTNTTGVFYGVDTIDNKLFEKLIIVELNKNYVLKRIIEIDWETFFKYKRWHNRMKAYNLNITKDLLNDSKIVFSSNEI